MKNQDKKMFFVWRGTVKQLRFLLNIKYAGNQKKN